ncbi:MAG: hypothetical protein ACJAZN_000946 [Planctomycetota bacterium]|jgi:hypothetical protein
MSLPSPTLTPRLRQLLGGLTLLMWAVWIGAGVTGTQDSVGAALPAADSGPGIVAEFEGPNGGPHDSLAAWTLFDTEDEDDEQPEHDGNASEAELRWSPPALATGTAARRAEPQRTRQSRTRRVRGPPSA